MHELSSGRRRFAVGTSKIALSLGLCLCAGQLVATPASAAVAPASVAVASSAGVAAATVAPRMTIAASARTIGWGSTVKVTARLVDPRTGKAVTSGSVRFQAYRAGAWRTWETKKVSSTGYVSFWTKPGTTYSFRTQYTGATGYRWALSPSIRITVKASGAKIIAEAKKHKGKAYRFGASGPRNFDCSGFTMYVYKKAAGKKLPHKANSQQKYGKAVSKANAKPGDLVVVRKGSYGTHAGIYAGNGYMWASPRSGKTVTKQKIWSRSYVVKRLV